MAHYILTDENGIIKQVIETACPSTASRTAHDWGLPQTGILACSEAKAAQAQQMLESVDFSIWARKRGRGVEIYSF